MTMLTSFEHFQLTILSGKVFRDVTDPMFAGGAKRDGVTDDTAAINGQFQFRTSLIAH